MNTLNKEYRVIMLATDNTRNPKLFKGNDNKLSLDFRRISSSMYHLYILSDDEIKLNDWYLNLDVRTTEYGVIQADTERLVKLANDAPSCKKIIATTDISLLIEKEMDIYILYLLKL